MSLELPEKTDINELVYELSLVKDLVNSLPQKCFIEELSDSEDIASIYFGLRNYSLLISDLLPNEIETVLVYSTIIYEDVYTRSFVIGCTLNDALYQLRIITNVIGKTDEVLVEQYEDGTYRTVSCAEFITPSEFEMGMILKNILIKGSSE